VKCQCKLWYVLVYVWMSYINVWLLKCEYRFVCLCIIWFPNVQLRATNVFNRKGTWFTKCVYVCVCMYVCTHVWQYLYRIYVSYIKRTNVRFICIYTCSCTYTHLYIYKCIYRCVNIYTYMNVCMYHKIYIVYKTYKSKILLHIYVFLYMYIFVYI